MNLSRIVSISFVLFGSLTEDAPDVECQGFFLSGEEEMAVAQQSHHQNPNYHLALASDCTYATHL
jgi:hypothetical protein